MDSAFHFRLWSSRLHSSSLASSLSRIWRDGSPPNPRYKSSSASRFTGGSRKDIDAILYRRNAQNPERTLRIQPAEPDAHPVLVIHLSDLFFGFARGQLPSNLQQRVERDETIEVDMDDVREAILAGQDYGMNNGETEGNAETDPPPPRCSLPVLRGAGGV
jgi:hypothetical protein